jgi:hypothetical protein
MPTWEPRPYAGDPDDSGAGDPQRIVAPEFKTGADPGDCPICGPHVACDDPDRHLGVPPEYAPLAARGCHCGADIDGRDCMCFEGV